MDDDLKTQEKPPSSKFLGVRTSAMFEIVAFFVLLALIAFLFGLSLNYYKISPHPFWIIVVLISTQYGTNAGLIAALIATVIFLLGPIPPRNILQEPAEYFFLIAKLPLLWFVAALILGELRIKQLRETERLRIVAQQAEEKEKKIAESYIALKKIKEHLEMRVVSEMQTTLSMITTFELLEKTDKAGVIKGALELTKTLVAPEKFSIYLLDAGELKCVAANEWEPNDHYAKSFNSESLLFQEVIQKRRVVSYNLSPREILGKEGVLAVPIANGATNEVFGMIKIEQIPFLRLRTATIESLRSIGDWVGKAYANILAKEGKK